MKVNLFNRTCVQLLGVVSLLVFLGKEASGQFYTGHKTDFGKNRVQFEERLWTIFHFKRFDTYYYEGGKKHAIFTSRVGQKHLDELEQVFDYRLNGKIQFLVFNSLADMRQSNIGYDVNELNNTGGVTRIVGSKVFVYFDGNHKNLEREIRGGIARVMINQMMYGGDIKDMVKNATLLSLPEWYVEGLVSYMASGWDSKIDDRVRDGILSGRYKKFNRLTGEDALYAGHSIWHYIVETYGESVLSNILYMTKITRNIDSGFLFVVGGSLKNITNSWLNYYNKKYLNGENSRDAVKEESLLKRPKKGTNYSMLRISPGGKYAAYVSNQIGLFKVKLYDLSTQKQSKIIKKGYRTIEHKMDESYPLLAWHPTGKLLSIISEKKGGLWITTYEPETGEKEERELFNFQKIIDFSYSQDGKYFAFSAVQNGFTDIYVYHVSTNTYKQITKDIYDDLSPRFIDDSRKIVFSSNRVSDTIRFSDEINIDMPSNTDLFVYDYERKNPVLKRITNTPLTSESGINAFKDGAISYLSDKNGIWNRYVAFMDSVISHIDTTTHYRYVTHSSPVTNYNRNIIEQDIDLKSGKYGEVVYYNGKYRMYVRELFDTAAVPMLHPTKYKESINQLNLEDKEQVFPGDTLWEYINGNENEDGPEIIPVLQKDTSTNDFVNIDDYQFEDDETVIQKPKEEITDTTVAKEEKKEFVFKLPVPQTYEPSFNANYLVSQLDNTYLNPTYQLFTGGGAVTFNPGLSGLFKLGIIDMLEDYKVTGGFRMSFSDLSGNEYFMRFDNLRKRLDRSLSFYRLGTSGIYGFSVIKFHTHEMKYVARWPFTETLSLKGTANLRADRAVFLSTDFQNLQVPNLYSYLGGLKAEFILDNTIKRGLNLYNGTRGKLFAEYFRFIEDGNKHMIVLGADFRHYQKIHRDLIWANRFAASTSFGPNKLIYYVGGVDNWLVPKFNHDIPIDFSQQYAFQALGTNMRGFWQNARNGNSFAVINSEVRFPVFKYFMNRPIKSDFLSNFQIVGFGDVGSAWTGDSPYSPDNSLNTQVIVQGPITATINKQIEPIIAGYGFGLRSRVWGYFIRTDWSWGIEDGVIQPSQFYISLSLDF